MCVRACVRACVGVFVRACVRACTYAFVLIFGKLKRVTSGAVTVQTKIPVAGL